MLLLYAQKIDFNHQFEKVKENIIPLVRDYKEELEALIVHVWILADRQKLCDERAPFKLERDHYHAKMEKIGDTNQDAELVARVCFALSFF